MLRKHEWKLTEIQSVEDDDSELTVKTKEAAAKEHPIPPGPRRDQNAWSLDHPRIPEESNDKYPFDSDDLVRKRPHSQCSSRPMSYDHSDPRRDSLEPSIFGRYARKNKRSLPADIDSPDYRRKSICVHCWLTRGFFDFYGQCGTCRIDNIKCVRKLCDAGLSCRNPRCPCLHPGEWDEKDPDFVVETGPLPVKGESSSHRVGSSGDHYRAVGGRRDSSKYRRRES